MKKVLNKLGKCEFSANSFQLLNKEVEIDESTLKMSKESLYQYMEDIEELIESNQVIAFIKGTRYVPECGFSDGMVYILEQYPIKYKTFDVNNDTNYKEALKIYSEWPTIPQLYVDGDLIGGFQIAKELHAEGELLNILPVPPDWKLEMSEV